MKELTVRATLESIPVATAFVDAQLEALDCPMKPRAQIDVAIDELLGNIVQYAYPGEAGDATVRFDFDGAARTARVTFVDAGVPFDPLQRNDPDLTLPAEARQLGGLGIYMARKLMDRVEYQRLDGRNILTIHKRI